MRDTMMRASLLFALLLLLPLTAAAQDLDTSARNYSVRYEKEHLFLQKDSCFNVVDYDIEWPEILDYDSVPALRRCISGTILGYATANFDSLLMSVGNVYGKPVAGPFKELPDDNRFCYVEASARLLSYQPGRWVAYMLDGSVEPQKLSPHKRMATSVAMVYDLTRGRVMLADDMLRGMVKDMMAPTDFYNRLLAPLSDEMYDNLASFEIEGVWVDGGQVNFLVDAISNYGHSDYTVAMPYDYCRDVLTRNARNMVEKELKPTLPKYIPLPLTWKGDTIYKKVEQMPEFQGGQDGLRSYLAHVGNPDMRLDKPARVYLSFVIDKEGKVQDVSVVSPVSPRLDEHAVGVIKGLPPFIPGRHNGEPVCVRVYFPVNYKP